MHVMSAHEEKRNELLCFYCVSCKKWNIAKRYRAFVVSI